MTILIIGNFAIALSVLSYDTTKEKFEYDNGWDRLGDIAGNSGSVWSIAAASAIALLVLTAVIAYGRHGSKLSQAEHIGVGLLVTGGLIGAAIVGFKWVDEPDQGAYLVAGFLALTAVEAAIVRKLR